MAEVVYILCGLTSLFCALLLLRQYRKTSAGLLLWSTLCFCCLALNNILLFLDLVVLPKIDLSVIRNALTLAAMLMMLYGLIRESTR